MRAPVPMFDKIRDAEDYRASLRLRNSICTQRPVARERSQESMVAVKKRGIRDGKTGKPRWRVPYSDPA